MKHRCAWVGASALEMQYGAGAIILGIIGAIYWLWLSALLAVKIKHNNNIQK